MRFLCLFVVLSVLSLSCAKEVPKKIVHPLPKYHKDSYVIVRPEDKILPHRDDISDLIKDKGAEILDEMKKLTLKSGGLSIGLCYELDTLRNEYLEYCHEFLGDDYIHDMTNPNIHKHDRKAAQYAVEYLKGMNQTVDYCYLQFD